MDDVLMEIEDHSKEDKFEVIAHVELSYQTENMERNIAKFEKV